MNYKLKNKTMKKLVFCVLTVLAVSLVLNSCKKEEPSFDQTLLIGKWKLITPDGVEFYNYINGGTGKFWYDDVPEAEARNFTWTLDKADLTLIHQGDGGVSVPEYFTVTELTATSFKYKDNFGDSYSLTKFSK